MSACSMLDNPCYFAKINPNKFDIVLEYLEICEKHPIKDRFIRQHVFGMLSLAVSYPSGILREEFLLAPEYRGRYAESSKDIRLSMEIIKQFKLHIESLPPALEEEGQVHIEFTSLSK